MISIRPMAETDLPAARVLLEQLGYAVDADEAGRRFAALGRAPDHAVLTATLDGRVVALMHIYARPALEKPPEAIVQALVVDAHCRKGGIGKAMMAAAERWAAERGFSSVALTSQVARKEAHAFYEALGYRVAGTSHLLRKKIGA